MDQKTNTSKEPHFFEYKMQDDTNWIQSKWPIEGQPETKDFDMFTEMVKDLLGENTVTRKP